MRFATLLTVLPALAVAGPARRWTAGPEVGATTSDVYPPTGTSANTALFPDESVIGYPGPTPTGEESAAIETAPAYAYNHGPAASFPLVASPKSNNTGFEIFKYWGNLSPWYSVPSSQYGLPDASPLAPENCSVTQVQLLYRHGARYPTSGAPPSAFAAKLHNATEKGLTTWGELEFLNKWTYKLGAELLTPFGRSQNFELGVAFRQQYGYLLNNFTEHGQLPVFTTESQDRMVKTALNFAAGFFGVPEYIEAYNLEIVIETPGLNNTGAPYEICTNSNVDSRGYQGSAAAAAFTQNAFNSTLDRLNSQVQGVQFLPSDAVAMLQLCAYETDALGYSAFCELFTEEDFKNFEYQFSLSFYYSQGFGSPVAAAQGKGYLQQFLARLSDTPIDESDSANNKTFTGSSTYFPTNQSIYADATHEVVVLDTLTALNLTALYAGGPLDLQKRTEGQFSASRVVPFGTHLVIQVLECSSCKDTKQIRFIVNDAVVPVHDSYEGCEWNRDGMCAFDTVMTAWKKRIQEINFDYDCFANYTSSLGQDYNGRAPAM